VRFSVATLPNRPWAELAAQWQALDAQGWDAIYVSDHLGNPYRADAPWRDAWTCLAGLALETRHARIGPLVSSIVFRPAAAVAQAARAVDEASGGRLDVAIGAGSPRDHAPAGVEPWSRAEREQRVLAYARRLRELLPAGVPLVAGRSDAALRAAAEVGDGWNTYVGRRLSADEGRARAAADLARLDAFCAVTGRSPRRSALLGHRFVAEEPFRSEEAFARVARAWAELGFDELVVYADPYYMVPLGEEAPPGIVERIARDVLPELRSRG
jgi:alkanesulfonate monooxygenase SsuD/methylene tetrahydromethanopterin reductase-like flavin-dependent oxidoreductase (luciferase family)